MNTILIALVCIVVATAAYSQDYGKSIYISPDEKLRVEISPATPTKPGPSEHRVVVQMPHGDTIARNDHTSPDHQHGRAVLRAAWTPDSKYFIYSTTSSGGHSAWHFTTFVYVRALKRFFVLDDYVGAITDPSFVVSPPDRIHTSRINPAGQERGTNERPLPVEVNLSQLKWNQ